MLIGCGVELDAPDEGEAQQDVINGNTFSGTDRLIKILFRDSNGSGCGVVGGTCICTGTLITPSYVLTAAHCANQAPANYNLTLGNNGATSGVDLIKVHPNLDVALLHLTTPLASPGFQSSMYTYTDDSLNGKSIELQGFGNNTCSGGNGVMRYADITGGTHDAYNTNYNGANSQGSGGGDSGGPFWLFFRGVPFQTGVVKGGNCAGNSFGSNPEIFENWVFAQIYGSPVSIPTTTACHNHVCNPSGTGEWFLSNGTDFWDRPLAEGNYSSTASFNPCPGSSNYYLYRANWSLNGSDAIRIDTGYSSPTLTGTNEVAWWGLGQMRLEYSTAPGSGSSPGMNWLDVQCDYFGKAEDLVCHGARCATTLDPIPPSYYKAVSWTPCGGGAFYYFLNSNMVSPDWIYVNGTFYSGKTDAQWQYVSGGTATVAAWTGSTNNYSPGIRSLHAVCAGW
jgi:hypothetical protein